MRTTTKFLLVAFAFSIVTLCFATQYSYTCSTPKCGFEGYALDVGPIVAGGHVTGYCCKCKKFVSLRWKTKLVPQEVSTNLPYAPPEKLATVWNAATGREANLYACPECQGPFMQIDDSAAGLADRRMFCPRCGKRSLDLQGDILQPGP